MSLSDIITTPFLICLGVSLLLIGLLGMYFTHKLGDQDHKISSMFGLVSSMAEEMNYMRSKFQTISFSTGQQGGTTSQQQQQQQNNVDSTSNNKLIDVSDGEDLDNDSDSDSEGDSDSEDDSDSDGDADSDGEGDDNIQIAQFDILNDINSSIKVINISENFSINKPLNLPSNIVDIDTDNEDDNDNNSIQSLSDSSTSSVSIQNIEDLSTTEIASTSSIGIENLMNADILKKINISNLEESSHSKTDESIDYKKMTIANLRTLVVSKGLSTNAAAAKLKKEELIKMLTAE